MAIGDIITDLVSIAGAGTVYFQPSAGTQIIITSVSFSSSAAGDASFRVFDVVIGDGVYYINSGSPTDGANTNLKVGITNSIYLQFYNANAAAKRFAYTGFQTK